MTGATPASAVPALGPGAHRTWLGVGQAWSGPIALPLIVLQGDAPGPRLVAIAAQHGDEGYAVLGCHRIAETLDPRALRGSLWMIPCANPVAFAHGKRHSPFDGQDMNAVHPGGAAGTITEQIAHALATDVLPGARLLLDLHGGSPENGDVAFARWRDVPGLPSAEAIVRRLPVGFTVGDGRHDLPGMIHDAAVQAGVPAIAVEACNAYARSTDNATEFADVILAALRALDMVDGRADARDLPARRMRTHRARTAGAWESFVSFGQTVERGEPLGVIRNLVGDRVQLVHAEAHGSVAVMRTGVRVHPGETVCTLATDDDA